MFKGFVVKAFLAVTLLLAACGTKSETEGAAKKISVIAVTYPQYDWFKNVLGGRADAVDLKLLIKNGADLHSYQPSAQDIAAIASPATKRQSTIITIFVFPFIFSSPD